MSEKTSFDFVVNGKKYEFETKKDCDQFIIDEMWKYDFSEDKNEVDADAVLSCRSEENRAVVGGGNCKNLVDTVDAMLASTEELTKIAIDIKLDLRIVRHFIDVQESLQYVLAFLTEGSYKGRAK